MAELVSEAVISRSEMLQLASTILQKVGTPKEDADSVADSLVLAQEAGHRFSDTGSGLKPTHTLGAVFRSSTRAHRNSDGFVDSRVDLYMLSFELAEIESREVVWTDSFDFKRVAVGELHN